MIPTILDPSGRRPVSSYDLCSEGHHRFRTKVASRDDLGTKEKVISTGPTSSLHGCALNSPPRARDPSNLDLALTNSPTTTLTPEHVTM